MHVLITAINVPTRWPIGLLTVSNILPSVAMKFKYKLFYSILFYSKIWILSVNRTHLSLIRTEISLFFKDIFSSRNGQVLSSWYTSGSQPLVFFSRIGPPADFTIKLLCHIQLFSEKSLLCSEQCSGYSV